MKTKLLFVAFLLVFVSLATAVRQLNFVLDYTGKCKLTEDAESSNGNCTLKAQSEQLLTMISGSGDVTYTMTPLKGSISVFNFTDRMFPNRTYTVKGTLTFGVHQIHQIHRLYVQTLGLGYMSYAPHGGVRSVVSSMNVTGGGGTWQNAHGTVTMNGYTDIASTDTHLSLTGVVWLDPD